MATTFVTLGTMSRLFTALAIGGVVIAAEMTPAKHNSAVLGLWTAPTEAAARANPLTATTSVVALGRDLFMRDCASCHGERGRADGPLASWLPQKPLDLALPAIQSQTDGVLFWKIAVGRGRMLSTQNTMTDDERWAVVGYVRSLGDQP